MNQFLPEYAAGTLPAARHAEVARHLAGCADCRAEVAAWRSLAGIEVEPPGPDIVRRALLQGVLGASDAGAARSRRWRRPIGLLRAELHLIPMTLWVASALSMAGGTWVAHMSSQSPSTSLLSLVAPIVVALGVAAVCAGDRDPAFEVCAATVTGRRVVLVTRVTLVLAYNIALALAGSAVLWLLVGGIGPVDAWLGPTVLLSSLALLAAVLLGGELAAAVSSAAWLVRIAAGGAWGDSLAPVKAVWTTNLGTVSAGLALLVLAVVFAGRVEPRRPDRATYLT